MNVVVFSVAGNPRGKARARTFYDSRMGKMRSITPEQTKDYERLIRWNYKAAGGVYMGEKLIDITITAFYPVPKSFSKSKREAALSGKLRPTTKPDVDNCAKAVLDALNGVCYADDRQVVGLKIDKYYGVHGYLAIFVEGIENARE